MENMSLKPVPRAASISQQHTQATPPPILGNHHGTFASHAVAGRAVPAHTDFTQPAMFVDQRDECHAGRMVDVHQRVGERKARLAGKTWPPRVWRQAPGKTLFAPVVVGSQWANEYRRSITQGFDPMIAFDRVEKRQIRPP